MTSTSNLCSTSTSTSTSTTAVGAAYPEEMVEKGLWSCDSVFYGVGNKPPREGRAFKSVDKGDITCFIGADGIAYRPGGTEIE